MYYYLRRILPFVVLLICVSALRAQQDPMFTKYMFNSLVFNPAYAGSKEYLTINALHRSQWLDWNTAGNSLQDGASGGAPTTQTFTIHGPANKRVGLGLNLINDEIGVSQSTSINMAYAYRIDFGTGTLSLGLQGGIRYWRADWDRLTYRDPRATDRVFSRPNPQLWMPNFGGGFYYYSEKFYFGGSVPSLVQFDLRDEIADSEFRDIARSYRHYYFTVGGAIPLDGLGDFVLKPSLLVKSVGLFEDFANDDPGRQRIGAPNAFDIDVSMLFYETVWLGLSYRSAFEAFAVNERDVFRSSHDSADFWLSLQLPKGIRIGAAYDFPLSALREYTVGSVELMVGYDFNYELRKIQTPRYF